MKIINRKLSSLFLIGAFVLVNLNLMALVKSPPEKAILPNGLKVIVVEDKSLPVVAAGLIFNAAPYYLNNCNSGIGNIYKSLIESADFKNETRFDFNARLEKVGILSEFGGSQEMLYAACNGNKENLDLILESLFNLSFNLKPSVEVFDKAKDSALRHLKTSQKFPQSSGLMEKMIWKDLYPDLANDCHGPINQEMLEKAQLGHVDAFVASVLVPNNAVLVIIGDVSASDVFAASMKRFGELQAAAVSVDEAPKVEAPAKSRKSENIDYFDIEETEVLLGFEAPGYTDPEMAAAFLWQAALHDINNSWLEYVVHKDFPELKNLFARYIPGRERGIFLIGFSSKEADANRPINSILNSLANLANDPPKGNELQRLVDRMQLKNLEKRESRLERVFDLGRAEIMGNYRIAEGSSAAFSRVVPEDMKKLASRMFASDRYSVRIVYPIKTQKAEETNVRLKTLDNGARLIVRNFPGSEVVGLTVTFGVDSCAPDIETQRMTRMVAEMVCAFINDNENRRLSNRLDDIGARMEANFTNESLLLIARTQKQKLPELLSFLKELLQKPEFSEKFFNNGKKKLLEKLEDDKANPLIILTAEIAAGLFPGLNYYSPRLERSDVDKITYAQVEKFYREWAVASNLCVSAVGNFDAEKTLSLLDKTFADMPKGKAVNVSQCPDWVSTPLAKTEVKEVKLPASSEHAYIAVSFRMKQFLHLAIQEDLRSNFGANSVIAHILFGSSNALIAQELKKIDANRGLWGGYRTNQQFSVFSIYAAVPVEKVDEAKQAIEKVVSQIPALNVSQDDIVASGKKLKSFFNRALERSDAQSAVLASYLQNGLKEDFLEEMLSIYSAVTVEDVKKGAREQFNNYLMLIARPEK